MRLTRFFFEKINKIDKPLKNCPRREKSYVIKNRDDKKDIAEQNNEIQSPGHNL